MKKFFFLVLAGCSSPTMTSNDAVLDASDVGMEAAMEVEVGGSMCTSVVQQFLDPKDSVSMASVTVVSDMAGVKTVYVDATAGGFQPTEPRVYVALSSGMRVDITDKQAPTSTQWDLAFKRYVIFTNSGDTGPGKGGTMIVPKAFDQVTSADAMGTFNVETLVDKDCNPMMDMLGGPNTTFSGWYNYNMQTMQLTPKAVTYIVRGANGTSLYKIAIQTYYGLSDGGTGMTGANFVFKLAAL